jgi:hypothetical protein
LLSLWFSLDRFPAPKITEIIGSQLDEAGAGIEPANSGFADRDLTTWLPRRCARRETIECSQALSTQGRTGVMEHQNWSCGVLECQDCEYYSIAPLLRFDALTNPHIVTV